MNNHELYTINELFNFYWLLFLLLYRIWAVKPNSNTPITHTPAINPICNALLTVVNSGTPQSVR